jgi:hypothetical protein
VGATQTNPPLKYTIYLTAVFVAVTAPTHAGDDYPELRAAMEKMINFAGNVAPQPLEALILAQPTYLQKATVGGEPPTSATQPPTQPVLRPPPSQYDNLTKPPLPRGAILPPAEYDHEYTGKLDIVKVQDGEQVRALCPDAFPNGGYPIACAQVRPNSCTIVITPEEIIKRHGYTLEAVLRYERAHCNGFRH